ncbi:TRANSCRIPTIONAL ADAPTOR 2 ADA2 -RELATED [Salix koriyanagi]|uniref:TRANSCRIPTIONAL ADAPTOR 2 ADA2 -RELATED n=1 Tax=Salix koriyanagi TaxID=2511006 RepID=A0A9Q0SSR6_9ROSI|nr:TRANSCRIPTIONAL ADAPTOR 2 ADA2 -RELATED [Salix koriyanagi]
MVVGSSSAVSGGEGAAETKPKEIRLFGVRVVVDNFRRNEEDAGAAGAGYMSADDTVHHSSSASGRRGERKRGVPWTEEEHRRFLFGLQKVGKGDWRGISRNFVKTRTPTQVASHAQKHFLRLNSVNRRRRRTSLFDITADTVTSMPKEEQEAHRPGQQWQQPRISVKSSATSTTASQQHYQFLWGASDPSKNCQPLCAASRN